MLLADIDYVGTPPNATFTTGDTSVTVIIPVVDDRVVNEVDEAFSATLSIIPTTGVRVELGDVSTVRGIIQDTSKEIFHEISNIMCYCCIARPQITTHPVNKLVEVNNDSTNVQFTCMAEGATSYFWQRRGRMDINSNAMGITTNALTLISLTPDDNGDYRCVAENEHGRNFTNYAKLSIKGIFMAKLLNFVVRFIINVAKYKFLYQQSVGK